MKMWEYIWLLRSEGLKSSLCHFTYLVVYCVISSTLAMSLSNVEKEMQCVTHWFSGWSALQKQDFMTDLLDKLVPNNVDTLFDSMKTLGVQDKPPSIFQCQLNLFNQWFSQWTDQQRNDLMLKLQVIDPVFTANFNSEAGRLTQTSAS